MDRSCKWTGPDHIEKNGQTDLKLVGPVRFRSGPRFSPDRCTSGIHTHIYESVIQYRLFEQLATKVNFSLKNKFYGIKNFYGKVFLTYPYKLLLLIPKRLIF